ncbi:MAG TPA: AAC(3) family N-acetyltransferase [Bacteroidales bacterium]|nr:AAC(3) family N-acetyltransferase [Bacteroidales bacterium]
MKEQLRKEDLVNDLKKIGIKEGDLLHMKVSMKAIGNVEGGAKTLLDALLEIIGPEGTLISDAFVSVYPLPLTKEQENIIADDNTFSYAGAFANEMIKHPLMKRSRHPIQKFAAIGKRAEEFCYAHNYESGGYDLLDKMTEAGGVNLTIGEKVAGVGTTHVAIDILGFKRKQLNTGALYKDLDGSVKLAKVNWNGGCAHGFPKFIPLYHEQGAVLGSGKVGNAIGLYTSMQKTLQIEIETLKKNPQFFFCDDKTCYSCQMTWEHSPKKKIRFYYNWLKKNFKNLSFSRIKNLTKTIS